MNAEEAWGGFSSTPIYQGAPLPVKNAMALQWFDQKLAPNVPKEQLDDIRHDFFSSVFPKPAPQPETSVPEQFGRGLIMKPPSEGEGISTIPQAAAREAGELVPQTALFMGTGAAAGSLLAKAGISKMVPLAARFGVPEALAKVLPSTLKEAVTGGLTGAEIAEIESRGKASPGEVAKSAGMGALLAGAARGAHEVVPMVWPRAGQPVFGGPAVGGTPESPRPGPSQPVEKSSSGPPGTPGSSEQPLPTDEASSSVPPSIIRPTGDVKFDTRTTELIREEVKMPGAPKGDAAILQSALARSKHNLEGFEDLLKSEVLTEDQARFVEKRVQADRGRVADIEKRLKMTGGVGAPPAAEAPEIPKDLPDSMRRWVGQLQAMPIEPEARNLAVKDFLKYGKPTVPLSFEEADWIGRNLNIPPDKMLSMAKESALQSPEWVGMMRTAASIAEEVKAVAAKARPDMTPEETMRLNLEREAIQARSRAFMDAARGQLSDYARGMSYARVLKEAAMSKDTAFIERAKGLLGEEAMTADKWGKLQEMFKQDPRAAMRYVGENLKQGWFDKLLSWSRGNALFQTTTPGRVIEDNTAQLLTQPFYKGAGAGIDWLEHLVTGKPQQRFVWAETMSRIHGDLAGTAQGLREAMDALKTGISSKDIEDFRIRPTGGPFRAIGDISGRVVTAAHLVPRVMAETGERFAQATNLAMRELAEGKISKDQLWQVRDSYLQSLPKAAEEAVKEEGRGIAYQDKPGTVGGNIKRLLNTDIGFGIKPLRLIVLFDNIAVQRPMRVLEYTPAGIFRLAGENLTHAQKQDVAAKMIIGAAAAKLLIPAMAKGDILWGAGPMMKSKAERDQWLAEHKFTYGVRVPGTNQIIGYKHMGPLGTALGMLASGVDQYKYETRGGESLDQQKAMRVAYALGSTLYDESFLRPTATLLNVPREMPRGTRTGGAVGAVLTPILEALIPASGGLRETAHLMDRGPGGSAVRDTRGEVGKRMMADLPGMTQFAPPKRDFLGRQVYRPGGVVQPVQHAEFGDHYAEFLQKLDYTVPSAPRSLHGMELDDKSFEAFQKDRGRVVRNILDNVMHGQAPPGPLIKPALDGIIREATTMLWTKYAMLQDPRTYAISTSKLTPEQKRKLLTPSP